MCKTVLIFYHSEGKGCTPTANLKLCRDKGTHLIKSISSQMQGKEAISVILLYLISSKCTIKSEIIF